MKFVTCGEKMTPASNDITDTVSVKGGRGLGAPTGFRKIKSFFQKIGNEAK
jgi:hypothetical protein